MLLSCPHLVLLPPLIRLYAPRWRPEWKLDTMLDGDMTPTRPNHSEQDWTYTPRWLIVLQSWDENPNNLYFLIFLFCLCTMPLIESWLNPLVHLTNPR
ncbi:hypothetical protein FA13DRAFT_47698 [Coprinellus micaceus]|uniref:Uncharacterized protein n=1 Tax=Coprinellus micaceus TaxID=71717 RepID=A0A4Y7U2K4_COPMI|nr:hypothetical protein FA13DRAFT_47698 [Coprinellus micaceus]